MPGEPPSNSGGKAGGKVKRISIPRVHSSTDAELQSQQSTTPLQATAPSSATQHYVTFRNDLEDSPIPPALRTRLLDIFQMIEKEFEMLCAENVGCELFCFSIHLILKQFYYIILISNVLFTCGECSAGEGRGTERPAREGVLRIRGEGSAARWGNYRFHRSEKCLQVERYDDKLCT